jgi:outer membrane lipoprotein-sorting protein
VVLAFAQGASAQTADEVIEKSITAMGGREAMAKLKSRSMIGTIALTTPAGDIPGTIEVLNALPNKARTLIKADLSAFGAGQLVVDQRFNGTTGYVLDSLQGDRDITGNQLDNMKANSFPHPFMNYKAMGTTVKLVGKEKAGTRDAFVLLFEPTAGSAIRQLVDAETYLPVRTVVTVDLPQVGSMEQTAEASDFRDLDGVKVPYKLQISSSVQSFTVTFSKVEHNVAIDEKLFSKP